MCYHKAMKKLLSLLLLLVLLGLAACARPAIEQVPLPSVTPAPAPTPLPTPTPVPDALTAREGVYTIAWLSDTQYYSSKWPQTFYAMTAFLRDEADRMDLRYFVHTGDIVNNYNKEEQWLVAVRAMASLTRLPGGVLAGNHDVHGSEADYQNFSAYFGENQFSFKPCYGESYQDNRGHFDLFEAGETAYIFVYMGYAPDAACIEWVRSVFDRFPERVGVLCLHDYFKTDLSLSDDGQRFYAQVVSQCPNVYLVLCGHRYNIAARPAFFDDNGDGAPERTVYQLIGNYQAAGKEGGSGYMRFIQIDEVLGEMRVYSYSPVLDDYVYYDDLEHQAEKYASDPAGEYARLPLPWLP
ncbi:MAG: metallophosphoesterase [Candidatus Pelethousia sp.]|nr:metallophosphoesterase [Candidatus Pelethousia sp.]